MKHSDATIQLLGKTLRYSFNSDTTPDYDAIAPADNPYQAFRIGLPETFFNSTVVFTPTGFPSWDNLAPF